MFWFFLNTRYRERFSGDAHHREFLKRCPLLSGLRALLFLMALDEEEWLFRRSDECLWDRVELAKGGTRVRLWGKIRYAFSKMWAV